MNKEFDGWDEIDWDIDIDSARFQLHIIEAWNKNNPNVKDEWIQWPNELGELKLILLPLGYIPSSWDKKSKLTEEESEQLKKDWLKLAQYISETDAIEIEENTFTVIGQHGSNFRFDISLEFHRWLPPNTLDMHYAALRNIRNGARNKHVLGNHIANLEATHCYDTVRASAKAQELTVEEHKKTRDIVHPLIRTHEDTGHRAIYFNPNRTDQVVGKSRKESDAILDILYAWLIKDDFQYEHEWQRGDLLMWDNRCLLHSVNVDFPVGQRREHQRILLEGTRPF